MSGSLVLWVTFAERGSASDTFQAYAFEWDSLGVRFFVGDRANSAITRTEVRRFERSVLNRPYFVILNLAVSGTFDGEPRSDAIFPATMLVDYVRVYAPTSR